MQGDRLGTDSMEGFARHWKWNVYQQPLLLGCTSTSTANTEGKVDVPLLGTEGHVWSAVPGLGSLAQRIMSN